MDPIGKPCKPTPSCSSGKAIDVVRLLLSSGRLLKGGGGGVGCFRVVL